jgi:hypothetical protein
MFFGLDDSSNFGELPGGPPPRILNALIPFQLNDVHRFARIGDVVEG